MGQQLKIEEGKQLTLRSCKWVQQLKIEEGKQLTLRS
jgi:hypothetical protein